MKGSTLNAKRKKMREMHYYFSNERKRCTRVPEIQADKISANFTLQKVGLGYCMTMLNAYPLKPAKARILEGSGDQAVVTGIMVSHIFRCARKIEVPQVYIKKVADLKKLRDQAHKLLTNKQMSSSDRLLLTRKVHSASTALIEELNSLAEAAATMIRNRERKYGVLMDWKRELDL